MQHTCTYPSPLGEIFLACDEAGLTGLWLEGQQSLPLGLDSDGEACSADILSETRRWLDTYFSGREPDFVPRLHLIGTAFQLCVWEMLLHVPYGQTTTYGEIARRVSAQTGRSHMSAQAVGGAVGRNKISIIIPCHRIVGTDGSLTGYAAGIDRKASLLRLEGVDMHGLYVPRRGTPV